MNTLRNRLLSLLPDPVVMSGSTDQPLVALTFDDGPNPPYTQEILAVLDRYRVKATFFLLGKNVRMWPGVAREVAAAGHTIGAHTYSHPVPFRRGLSHFGREIVQTHRLISRVTGTAPTVFRPPQGRYDPWLFAGLRMVMGYRVILWSVSAKDWRGDGVDEIATRVLDEIQPGGIVCLHDGSEDTADEHLRDRSTTVAVLPIVIEGLRGQGYELLSIPELLT